MFDALQNKALSTVDINSILKCFDTFVGAFPSDMVPIDPKTYPCAFVINTSPNNTDGDHWTALILEKDCCLFFDTLGFPILNNLILMSLKKIGIKDYKYNSKRIQSVVSNKCGHFCIAFILSYLHGYPYSTFLSNFVTDLKENDNLCKNFIIKHMNKQC